MWNNANWQTDRAGVTPRFLTSNVAATPRSAVPRAFIAFLVATLSGCSQLPPNVPQAGAFDAKRLEGGWHVVATNFPMWLDGSKTDPTFIYRVSNAGSVPIELEDTVAYSEGGKKETILGTDTQDASGSSHFTWRGRGLLSVFTSDWVILKTAPDDRFMVLYFSKTLATPEGVDVISRSKPITPEERKTIEALIEGDTFLKSKSGGIVWLK